jgi:hypothetical protein
MGCVIHVSNNSWAEVQGTKEEVHQVREILSYAVKGAQYTPSFQQGRWDGTRSLMRGCQFPLGLLPFVKDVISDIDIFDNRDLKKNGSQRLI